MTPEFWLHKRVLVTGHTGFKGSWLCLWLQSLGAEVHGLALEPETTPNFFEDAEVADRMGHNIVDIRNLAAVLEIVNRVRPEIVIHMAAISIVRYAYAEPVLAYSTNVMGTVNILEAARRHNRMEPTGTIKAMVVVTSDKCYENKEVIVGYKEEDPMGGNDPYSSSKGCAELVTAAYRRSYFSDKIGAIAVASARAGNVIGIGDWANDRLVPDAIRAFKANEPVVVRNPNAVRPWQYVLEPLSGYLLLAQKLFEEGQDFSGSWNFGPAQDSEQPVEYVVERIAELWGDGATWLHDERSHPHEGKLLFLDSTKSLSQLGWQRRMDFQSSLEFTVQGYKKLSSEHTNSIYQLALTQIEEYTHLCTKMSENIDA